MKKIIFVLVFLFLCVSMVFSDWFIGGDMNIFPATYNRSPYENRSIIEISPTVGFILNDKFDWGINAFISNNPPRIGNNVFWDYYSSFGLGIFGRYSFFNTNNFSILGQFGLDYSFANGNFGMFYWDYYERIISLNLKPILQYRLFDRLYLYTGIGGLFNISYTSSDNEINSGFSFNLSTNNISISLSDISIGFYILFDSPKNKQNNKTNRDTDGENIKQDESNENNNNNENVWW